MTAPLRFSEGVALNADNGDSQAVEQEEAGHHADIALPGWLTGLRELEAKGLGSVTLLAATALSMGLANLEPTSASWLGLWEIPVGPAVGGHVLSVRGWINEVGLRPHDCPHPPFLPKLSEHMPSPHRAGIDGYLFLLRGTRNQDGAAPG
ncbi:MAG: hypothetical protein SGPRY_000822 [Prymnesium sp.]